MAKKQNSNQVVDCNEVYFCKVRDVKSPNRANKNDAGIDFYMPVFDEKMVSRIRELNPDFNSYIISNGVLTIKPGRRILIPSGIRVWIVNKRTALIADNKSGISTKKGLTVTCKVVDADYTGEVHIGLHNLDVNNQSIQQNDKVVQFLHLPIIQSNLLEVSEDSYNDILSSNYSDRGNNGFGSTDKK